MEIDKSEVKRYLRISGGNDDGLDSLIDELSQKALTLLCPKSILNRFSVTHEDGGIRINGTDIVFGGNLVKSVFDGCDEIFIFAATLTLQSESLLKQCFAKSTVDGIVCDSVLTAMIESYCDEIDDSICKQVAKEGKTATRRISCGYGDFPLSCQKDILDILNAPKFLGIKLNENNMMLPNKTVTAVMGVKKRDFDTASCMESNSKNKCDCCDVRCGFKRQ